MTAISIPNGDMAALAEALTAENPLERAFARLLATGYMDIALRWQAAEVVDHRTSAADLISVLINSLVNQITAIAYSANGGITNDTQAAQLEEWVEQQVVYAMKGVRKMHLERPETAGGKVEASDIIAGKAGYKFG